MSVDPNAPAYPCRPSEAHKGLTIRQAYAMAAMQGSVCDAESYPSMKLLVEDAFKFADLMISHENGEASQ